MMKCPKCKSDKITKHWNYTTVKPSKYNYCKNCKYEWIDEDGDR